VGVFVWLEFGVMVGLMVIVGFMVLAGFGVWVGQVVFVGLIVFGGRLVLDRMIVLLMKPSQLIPPHACKIIIHPLISYTH
jgi:hypothetical protein